MLEELRQTCRRLLEEGKVQVVIGYGQADAEGPVFPVFITRCEDCDQLVFDARCQTNLAKYLLRKEIRALGKPAIVVKGCDQRALVVLEKESQIAWDDVVVIGMSCTDEVQPTEAKCAACDLRVPLVADYRIGKADSPPQPAPVGGEGTKGAGRYTDLEAFLEKPQRERWAYWKEELARCIKCYACRQVCPLCYCERCVVDKNRPTAIDTSATLKGIFAWQITRAFHLAGRCVGCDQCTRACPVGIDLRLLNLSLARAAENSFGFRPGMDPEAEPAVGTYSLQDREGFIR